MAEPRLTLVIPTLDRADLLHRAVDSCLRQTVPVRVIVADQGATEAVAAVMRRYIDHPAVLHMITDAHCLWENWRAGMQSVTTEFGAWLQDDDIIARGYAARVVKAFDAFPEAVLWLARLQCGINEQVASWWSGNGPWVPMRILEGTAEPWQGEILVPTAYLTSWSLSPAVAFRTGPALHESLLAMPGDCDLFAERLILAEMGSRGLFVADPVIAGYWIHHGKNESYRQHGDQDRQLAVMADHLDLLMARVDWQDMFMQWCLMMPAANIMAWLDSSIAMIGQPIKLIRELMQASLKGRIETVDNPEMEPFPIGDGSTSYRPRQKPANGQVRGHAQSVPDEVLIFDE